MRGPLPKHPSLRQRANKTSTRATLPSERESQRARIPSLPKRSPGTGRWHTRVREWWTAVWRSPMASEFLDADRQRLQVIAELHQKFWIASERGDSITKLATEIRQQEVSFGLTPMDRRRLQWEIDKGDAAEERTKRRKQPKADPKKDPRSVLRAV